MGSISTACIPPLSPAPQHTAALSCSSTGRVWAGWGILFLKIHHLGAFLTCWFSSFHSITYTSEKFPFPGLHVLEWKKKHRYPCRDAEQWAESACQRCQELKRHCPGHVVLYKISVTSSLALHPSHNNASEEGLCLTSLLYQTLLCHATHFTMNLPFLLGESKGSSCLLFFSLKALIVPLCSPALGEESTQWHAGGRRAVW